MILLKFNIAILFGIFQVIASSAIAGTFIYTIILYKKERYKRLFEEYDKITDQLLSRFSDKISSYVEYIYIDDNYRDLFNKATFNNFYELFIDVSDNLDKNEDYIKHSKNKTLGEKPFYDVPTFKLISSQSYYNVLRNFENYIGEINLYYNQLWKYYYFITTNFSKLEKEYFINKFKAKLYKDISNILVSFENNQPFNYSVLSGQKIVWHPRPRVEIRQQVYSIDYYGEILPVLSLLANLKYDIDQFDFQYDQYKKRFSRSFYYPGFKRRKRAEITEQKEYGPGWEYEIKDWLKSKKITKKKPENLGL